MNQETREIVGVILYLSFMGFVTATVAWAVVKSVRAIMGIVEGSKDLVIVPKKPDDECIESMCMRYDHSHGIKLLIPPETDAEFRRRQECNRIICRQLYEEAVGEGFYKRG